MDKGIRGCGVAKVLACQAAMQQSRVRFPPSPQLEALSRRGSCQGANDQALCDRCDSAGRRRGRRRAQTLQWKWKRRTLAAGWRVLCVKRASAHDDEWVMEWMSGSWNSRGGRGRLAPKRTTTRDRNNGESTASIEPQCDKKEKKNKNSWEKKKKNMKVGIPENDSPYLRTMNDKFRYLCQCWRNHPMPAGEIKSIFIFLRLNWRPRHQCFGSGTGSGSRGLKKGQTC